MEQCIDDLLKAGAKTRDEAQQILDVLDQRAEELRKQFGLGRLEAVKRAGQELTEVEQQAQAVLKRNAALNLEKRIARRNTMSETADSIQRGGAPDLVHAVMNQATARNKVAQGSRLSAEADWKALSKEYTAGVAVQLEKAGLLKYFADHRNANDWGTELYELSRKSAGDPAAQVGRTGSDVAQKAAEIVHGVQEAGKARANREGAWIGDYSGWITSTQHDGGKMWRAGFEKWRDFVYPRLDEKTFEGVENRNEFLQKTFNALVSGTHLADREAVGMKDPAFVGPSNIADRMSQGRKLHFKDAPEWMQYQREYGRGALNEQVVNTLDRLARQTALLRRWGTNPEAEFAQDMQWMAEKYRDTNPDAVARLNQQRDNIALRMRYMTGEANTPANATAAEIAAGIRAVQSMAKLGGVAFTHLSAFTTKAAEMRYHGVGFFDRWYNSIDSMMQGRGRGDQRALADVLLSGVEGMHGSMLSRFTADDGVPGTVSKLTGRYMQLTGLTWLLDAQKSGTARMMSRYIGQHLGESFDKLPPELQRTLTIYGFTPEHWDAVRSGQHFMVDGRPHLTPDSVHTADPDLIAALGRDPARSADDLYLKVRTMLGDIADRGIITPGIEERAVLTRGMQPGTVLGEAARFVAQFKTWGLAAVRQNLGREIYGGQSTPSMISSLMQMAAGMAVFGYTTMVLKDLFKGKDPRSPSDPNTWFAAMMQGGGFGLLGDYAFGEFNRFGQSPIESAAGPTFGTVADILKELALARGVATGDPNARAKDAGPGALRIALNNTPFINLFYVRRALDYLFLHSLQERMNPGYLQRTQQSMVKHTGQQFLTWPMDMRPTNHLHTFGR